jgi:hypothetical protein
MFLRGDTAPEKHPANSQEEYFHVEPKTAVFYVPYIERKLFLPIESVAAIDLAPTREPRQHFVPSGLL